MRSCRNTLTILTSNHQVLEYVLRKNHPHNKNMLAECLMLLPPLRECYIVHSKSASTKFSGLHLHGSISPLVMEIFQLNHHWLATADGPFTVSSRQCFIYMYIHVISSMEQPFLVLTSYSYLLFTSRSPYTIDNRHWQSFPQTNCTTCVKRCDSHCRISHIQYMC